METISFSPIVDFEHEGTTYSAGHDDEGVWDYSRLREYRNGSFEWVALNANDVSEAIKEAAENAVLDDLAAAEGF